MPDMFAEAITSGTNLFQLMINPVDGLFSL
jgi:hypothetical protein